MNYIDNGTLEMHSGKSGCLVQPNATLLETGDDVTGIDSESAFGQLDRLQMQIDIFLLKPDASEMPHRVSFTTRNTHPCYTNEVIHFLSTR